jgi:transcriptional regulator with XRE-family HTH domain
VRRREFPAITRLTQIGRLLIALRIAQWLTQRELAARLGISESLVSRDERNEYHGITVERAQRILDALNETVTARNLNETVTACRLSRVQQRIFSLAREGCSANDMVQILELAPVSRQTVLLQQRLREEEDDE